MASERLRPLPRGALKLLCERAGCLDIPVTRLRKGLPIRKATRDRIIAAATELGMLEMLGLAAPADPGTLTDLARKAGPR